MAAVDWYRYHKYRSDLSEYHSDSQQVQSHDIESRFSHIDTSKAAHHQLHGPTWHKSCNYESPDNIMSWGAQGTGAWYCIPSLDHNQNLDFFVPATGAYHTSG